ncbi:hypothetical protein [Coleofasciculus sp.]|uniref:hypothetical protein n=1 Tax=Coleofasciculus sp. TaxID=3100458 RepID=UPI003A46DEB5
MLKGQQDKVGLDSYQYLHPAIAATPLSRMSLTLEFVVSAVFASGTLRAYYEPSSQT